VSRFHCKREGRTVSNSDFEGEGLEITEKVEGSRSAIQLPLVNSRM
jgi:hypothetical protein